MPSHLHPDEPLDLSGDVVQDSDGDPLIVLRFHLRHESALERVVLVEQKDGEQQHGDRLSTDADHAQAAGPQQIRHPPRLIDHLDARDAGGGRCRLGCLCRRRVDCARCLLNPLDRGVALNATILADGTAEVLRAFGDLHQHRIDLRPERRRAKTDRADNAEDDEDGRKETRQPPAVESIDDRVEHVEQHHAQHDRHQQRSGVSHHRDAGADREHMKRRAAPPQGRCRGNDVGDR
jgi:hypothetical protein